MQIRSASLDDSAPIGDLITVAFGEDVWSEHDAAGLRDPLLGELEQALGAS